MDWLPTPLAALVNRLGGPARLGAAVRFLGVTILNLVNHQILLAIANSVWGWPGGWANAFAAVVNTIPAYLFTRKYVWSVNRSHSLSGEVVPFLALAALGLVVSSGLAALGEELFGSGLPVNLFSLIGYFIVWVIKFLALERIFAQHLGPEPEPSAGRAPAGAGNGIDRSASTTSNR